MFPRFAKVPLFLLVPFKMLEATFATGDRMLLFSFVAFRTPVMADPALFAGEELLELNK